MWRLAIGDDYDNDYVNGDDEEENVHPSLQESWRNEKEAAVKSKKRAKYKLRLSMKTKSSVLSWSMNLDSQFVAVNC